MLTWESFDSIVRTDSCLVAHLDRWDDILDQIMDDLGEIRDDDIDWGLSDGILQERMIAEWEASHFEFWRDDVETVGDFDSHLSWAEQD